MVIHIEKYASLIQHSYRPVYFPQGVVKAPHVACCSPARLQHSNQNLRSWQKCLSYFHCWIFHLCTFQANLFRFLYIFVLDKVTTLVVCYGFVLAVCKPWRRKSSAWATLQIQTLWKFSLWLVSADRTWNLSNFLLLVRFNIARVREMYDFV